MKKILFLLSIILSHLAIAAEFKFRVKCATSREKQFADIIQKIPELSPYMMPNGEKIYFSGKYFNEYSKAEKRLNQILALGFCNAEIRVFKDNQYLLHVLSRVELIICLVIFHVLVKRFLLFNANVDLVTRNVTGVVLFDLVVALYHVEGLGLIQFLLI